MIKRYDFMPSAGTCFAEEFEEGEYVTYADYKVEIGELKHLVEHQHEIIEEDDTEKDAEIGRLNKLVSEIREACDYTNAAENIKSLIIRHNYEG